MRFLDFFAGIGGFRLGMEMAGHECMGHCEIDKYAHKSYIAIHRPKDGEWYADDIRRVVPGDLPDADCYCFGFPCQSFSVAGKRGGFEDTRGTLFFEVMRLAAVRKPKYLFAENVAGLLSHDGGKTFGTIFASMGELGYEWQYQVLNSKDFGVPQNRERVFIVGHLRGQRRPEVFPITGTNSQVIRQLVGGQQGMRVYDTDGVSVTLASEGGGWGAKTGLYMINHPRFDQREISDTCQALKARDYKGPPNVLEVRPCLTPDRMEKRQNGRRFKEDGEPMFTLTGQDVHGVAISKRVAGWVDRDDRLFAYQGDIKRSTVQEHVYIKPEGQTDAVTVGHIPKIINHYRIRKLIPLECWRLQGFPDEYFYRAKEAGVSDTQLYKQAGNSVTVPVIYEIAKKLG